MAEKQLKTDHKTKSSKPCLTCLCSFTFSGIYNLCLCVWPSMNSFNDIELNFCIFSKLSHT